MNSNMNLTPVSRCQNQAVLQWSRPGSRRPCQLLQHAIKLLIHHQVSNKTVQTSHIISCRVMSKHECKYTPISRLDNWAARCSLGSRTSALYILTIKCSSLMSALSYYFKNSRGKKLSLTFLGIARTLLRYWSIHQIFQYLLTVQEYMNELFLILKYSE